MYPWVKFLHLLGAFGFVLSHGASAAVTFRLRHERELERIRALLDLSSASLGAMYISILVLLASGIWAGFLGGYWGKGWIWTALGLLIVLIVVMNVIAIRVYSPIRKAAGLQYFENMKPQPALPPASPEDIRTVTERARPLPVAVIGLGGLVMIVWLMVFKPF